MHSSKNIEQIKLEQSFVSITKLSILETRKLLRWFNNQNLEVQVDIFKEQRNQFFKYAEFSDVKEIVPVASFYMAIQHFFNLGNQAKLKNKSMKLKDIEKSTELSMKQFRKPRVQIKRDKLLNLWSIVTSLKTEGFSFRKISVFLRSKYRFSVSHSYIRSMWNELESGN